MMRVTNQNKKIITNWRSSKRKVRYDMKTIRLGKGGNAVVQSRRNKGVGCGLGQ